MFPFPQAVELGSTAFFNDRVYTRRHMGILPILTVLMIFINLLFSGMIYTHGSKKLTEIFYALTSFFASIWSLATLLIGLDNISLEVLNIGVLLHYVAGDLAYICILWFAVFNQQRWNQKTALPFLFSIINVGIIFWMIAHSNQFFNASQASLLQDRIIFQFPGYGIFVISLTVIFFLMIATLSREYENMDSVTQLPMRYILLATFFGGGSGILLNLYFPWAGDFRFFVINPIIVTLFFTGISFYALLKYKLFNIKVIGTELLTFVIWMFLLIQIFLAETQTTQILSGVLFSLTVIFGILQIQSVIKEIRWREQIQKLSLELRVANTELARINQAKSDFISMASHQLKTPLSIIKGYVSMTLEGSFGKITKKISEQLEKVFISNERLISLVEDLLNLSRVEAGRMKYDWTNENISDIVQQVVEEVRIAVEHKGLKLIWKPPPEKLYARVDLNKMRNVIFNMADNAIKYTDKGSITVTVTQHNQSVRVSVADTGRGISASQIQKLFTKFTRVMEGTSNLTTVGFGLGLYVARLIVDEHKGRIWAESAGLGKGSVFLMEVPLVELKLEKSKGNATVTVIQ